MGYVFEQMTMNDVYRVIEDAQSSGKEKEVKKAFERELAASEDNRTARLRYCWWGIDREKNHYMIRISYMSDGYGYMFYFRNSVYIIHIDDGHDNAAIDGLTRSNPEPQDAVKNEFQREFIEGCRVCSAEYGGRLHPVFFKDGLRLERKQSMAYVYEQMTMDDVNKVLEDVHSSGERHWLEKEVFWRVLAAPEEERAACLRNWWWAINREKNYYIFCAEDGRDSHDYVFYFRGFTYAVYVEREGGWTRYPSVLQDNMKDEFQREFIEGCRAYCTEGGQRPKQIMHPVCFKNGLRAEN